MLLVIISGPITLISIVFVQTCYLQWFKPFSNQGDNVSTLAQAWGSFLAVTNWSLSSEWLAQLNLILSLSNEFELTKFWF